MKLPPFFPWTFFQKLHISLHIVLGFEIYYLKYCFSKVWNICIGKLTLIYNIYHIISYHTVWPWTYFHSKKGMLSLKAANFSTLAYLQIFKHLWFTFSLTPHRINQTGSCLSHPPCHIMWIVYILDMMSLYFLFSPSKNAKLKWKWKKVHLLPVIKRKFSEKRWKLGSHRC